jgi:hypothetical protein
MGDVDVVFCDSCDGLFLSAKELEKHVKEAHAPPPPATQKASLEFIRGLNVAEAPLDGGRGRWE